SLPTKNLAYESPGNRHRMSRQRRKLSKNALKFVKDAQLPQHRRPVVVDLLSGQSILGVEGVDAAQRNLNAAACRRKAAAGAEMSSANQNLDQDGNFGNVLTLHLDFEVGQRGHELLVEPANPIPSLVVLAPRFVIVARSFAEGPKHTFQIMLVLESD